MEPIARPLPHHLQEKLRRVRRKLKTGGIDRGAALGVVASQIVRPVMPTLTPEPRLALAAMWLDG